MVEKKFIENNYKDYFPRISSEKLLIEQDFYQQLLSENGARERYKRKFHINAIKTWWARRPLVSSRGIIFSILTNNNLSAERNKAQQSIMNKIITSINPLEKYIKAAKQEIKLSNNNRIISLLDPFGGGGSIPFEASRLGLKSTTVDINPIAHLLEKAVLEFPQKYPNISEDVCEWGNEIISQSEKDLADVYPNPLSNKKKGYEIFTYFWVRKTTCPNCGKITPITKMQYLVKKPDRIIRIDCEIDKKNDSSIWKLTNKNTSSIPIKKPRGSFRCYFCKKIQSTNKFKSDKKIDFEIELQAICINNNNTRGKQYLAASQIKPQNFIISELDLKNRISETLNIIDLKLPKIVLKQWTGIINPTIYGFKYVDELFTKRQLLLLLTLIKNTRKYYFEKIHIGFNEKKAEAILVYLSSLLEHLADYNNTLTMWIAQNEQTGRSLAGPGLPMHWEFIELNPFSSGPSNLFSKLERIVTSLAVIPKFDHSVNVILGDCTKLPFNHQEFDIIVTDPPYYDNLFYSALSDLFIPWFELLFHGINDKFSELKTNPKLEITSSKHVHGSTQLAKVNYQKMMTTALSEMNRVLKNDGQIIIIYAHKSLEGWETLAEAIVNASLHVVTTIPLQMERKARPRSMKSDALTSTIVFVLTKRLNKRLHVRKDEFIGIIRLKIIELLKNLKDRGFLGNDIIISLTSHFIKYYSRYTIILNDDDIYLNFNAFYELLTDLANKIFLNNVYELPLNEFIEQQDEDTKLFLQWRNLYGNREITDKQFDKLRKSINSSTLKKQLIVQNKIFGIKNNKIYCHSLGKNILNGLKQDLSLIKQINNMIFSVNSGKNVNREISDKFKKKEDIIRILEFLSGIKLLSRNNAKKSKLTDEQKIIRKTLNRLIL